MLHGILANKTTINLHNDKMYNANSGHPQNAPDFQSGVSHCRALKHNKKMLNNQNIRKKKLHVHLSTIHVLVLLNPRFIKMLGYTIKPT